MKTIKYDHSKNQRDISVFVNELPYKLKIDLSMEIHKTIYKTIDFFKVKEKSFIAWIGPLLKPCNTQELEYIYKEGEDIKEIFFLVNGIAGYVLPRFENTVYIKIEAGDHFGHVDLVLDQEILAMTSINLRQRSQKHLTRKFTVQALLDCELLMLLIEDIEKMKIEFPDVFDELFMNSYRRLRKELEIKIQAIQQCEKATQSNNIQSQNAMKDIHGLHKEKTFELNEYKERHLKKKLTISDIRMISKFADNSTSLKQIDEELDEVSSSEGEMSRSDQSEGFGEIVELDPSNPIEVDFENSERTAGGGDNNRGLNQSSSNIIDNSRRHMAERSPKVEQFESIQRKRTLKPSKEDASKQGGGPHNFAAAIPKSEEEREFMLRFKKNFGRLLRKGSTLNIMQELQ
jgi:CRP-like cAMP-binding protein